MRNSETVGNFHIRVIDNGLVVMTGQDPRRDLGMERTEHYCPSPIAVGEFIAKSIRDELSRQQMLAALQK